MHLEIKRPQPLVIGLKLVHCLRIVFDIEKYTGIFFGGGSILCLGWVTVEIIFLVEENFRG